MAHKNVRWVILRTHVDEKLAIAHIVSARFRRKLAGFELEGQQRLIRARRALEQWQARIERKLGRRDPR